MTDVTAAAPAASASPAASAAAAPQGSGTALQSLGSNFNDFLSLLMTQLRNQDPASPMDPNAFTTELVQFAGVQQQINANTSLTQLIQLTQGGEVLQSSAMLGKQVQVAANQVPLQNGSGTIHFTAPSAGPVDVAIYSDAGTKLRDAVVQARQGDNSWSWDGTDANGRALPDGAYRVAVAGAAADGSANVLPFTVDGTVTGVQANGNSVQLQLGALSTDVSTVRSVGK